METITINGQEYEIIGYNAEDGLPIIRGIATMVHDGFDADGNKKISANITIPVSVLNTVPGDNGG